MTGSNEGVTDRKAEAFKVLVTAVRSLSGRGRPPTASEVRLEMRDLTYGGFSPHDVGYVGFRNFLRDAEAEGFVQIDESRSGDVAVCLPDSEESDYGQARPIRSDLWKAFIDWRANQSRWYDLVEDRVSTIPREPAPLEPERFREVRRLVGENPDRFVAIEPISMSTQLEWMREFSSTVSNPNISALLVSALEGVKPAKLFVTVLRKAPAELYRWHSELTKRVRIQVEKWRDAVPALASVNIDRLDAAGKAVQASVSSKPDDTEKVTPEAQILNLAMHTGRDLFSGVGGNIISFGNLSRSFSIGSGERTTDSIAELRNRLHSAIDRMPPDELRKIQIPVGYLFEM